MKCSIKICAKNQSDCQIAERTSIVRNGLNMLLLSEQESQQRLVLGSFLNCAYREWIIGGQK